jgi:hypothetical protein
MQTAPTLEFRILNPAGAPVKPSAAALTIKISAGKPGRGFVVELIKVAEV